MRRHIEGGVQGFHPPGGNRPAMQGGDFPWRSFFDGDGPSSSYGKVDGRSGSGHIERDAQVRVLAVARFAHQQRLAEQFGAARVLAWRPIDAIIAGVSQETRAEQLQPWYGRPMLNGGVDVVYDTVGSPESVEVGVRITRSRGRIVVTGVEMPKQFEWTPLYFKEIALIGSNAFAIEAYDGRRQHAMQWYFEFLHSKRLDGTPIITHRYRLEAYRDAFMTCWDQGKTGAVKVLFEFPSPASPPA